MKRTVLVIFSLALSFVLQAQRAPEAQASKVSCRESSLSGYYIYAQDGFFISGDQASQRTPFAQTGREYYDGKGFVSGLYTLSNNGKVTRGRYFGTYVLGPDCSGTVTFTDNFGATFHYDIYVTDGGDEFSFIQTDASVVSASYERHKAGSSLSLR